MEVQDQKIPCTLLELLGNALILNHVSPYLDMVDRISLAATSRNFQSLMYNTPGVFRYLDLTRCHSCLPFNRKLRSIKRKSDDFMCTDEYFAKPLQRILRGLRSRNILQDVRTLVLDGLVVPANVLREILCDEGYNIRILSLRDVRELGDEKLIQILRYIIRPSRPEGTPKLKGLYYFTPGTASADFSAADLLPRVPQTGITNAPGAQLGSGTSTSSGALHRQLVESSWHRTNPWYSATGVVLTPDTAVTEAWARLIEASEGIIAYDVVLCRHRSVQTPSYSDPNPTLATISLGGCQSCGSCPEGPANPRESAENKVPLLAPPPMHQSSVRIAQRLDTRNFPHPSFIARCTTCLKDRWCQRCNIWWCESCYTVPSKRILAPSSPLSGGENKTSIKVHNHLCVSKCLMDQLLNEVGEGGMWG